MGRSRNIQCAESMTKERKAMSVAVKEAVYSTTEGHDELPFRSDNPVYSDTWRVATVDPDSKQAFWAQVLHNGSSGNARHILMVRSDKQTAEIKTLMRISC